MVAQVSDRSPGDFVVTLGDAHLYLNHLDQAARQLAREPYPMPTMRVAPKADLLDFALGDFQLEAYQAHPPIRAPIAV
jgi:thymidylate synthase